MSDTNKKTSNAKEFESQVLKRLKQPVTDTITSLSEELKIPRTTIYQWFKNAKTHNTKITNNHKSVSK